jgi:hypothetical protein
MHDTLQRRLHSTFDVNWLGTQRVLQEWAPAYADTSRDYDEAWRP